ncbi:uncharacterized protein LOC114480766 [Gouania willdenowi]|uniref:uncharacterized protein LOC114480766 n=1 Tax=Gouania willdenowi TaxID=441366 RepID=UPI001054945A|nr:uncharacterized protein LOC114480766 [Gouania willdenowi]
MSLPCEAPGRGTIIIVEWTRTDLKDGNVLMYRDKQYYLEGQLLSYRDRVTLTDLQMKNSDISLILKNVTADDEGTYECRVDQLNSPRQQRSVLGGDPVCSISLRVGPPETMKCFGCGEEGHLIRSCPGVGGAHRAGISLKMPPLPRLPCGHSSCCCEDGFLSCSGGASVMGVPPAAPVPVVPVVLFEEKSEAMMADVNEQCDYQEMMEEMSDDDLLKVSQKRKIH